MSLKIDNQETKKKSKSKPPKIIFYTLLLAYTIGVVVYYFFIQEFPGRDPNCFSGEFAHVTCGLIDSSIALLLAVAPLMAYITNLIEHRKKQAAAEASPEQ